MELKMKNPNKQTIQYQMVRRNTYRMQFFSITDGLVELPIWTMRPIKCWSNNKTTHSNDKKYFENLHKWRKKSLLKTWIKTVILNTFCDYAPKKSISYSNCNFALLLCLIFNLSYVAAINMPATTPMLSSHAFDTATLPNGKLSHWTHANETLYVQNQTWQNDSIFMRLKKQFSSGNELWDGIIRDCYRRPTFTCFQKNVYLYLNDALSAQDVNITSRFKFFKNNLDFDNFSTPTESAVPRDINEDNYNDSFEIKNNDEHLLNNEIPKSARDFPAETPIEEVTNALYDKSVKFAMTHDVEIQMPQMMFDGATFRISPRSFEGNGVIAKLELIPQQQVEARLAGKIIMKKIRKILLKQQDIDHSKLMYFLSYAN